jgi:hypothetical protein
VLFFTEPFVSATVLYVTDSEQRAFGSKRLENCFLLGGLMATTQVNQGFIDQVLEVARHAAREVESAVSGVKNPHLRGVIAGVIMQRILEEVGGNEGRASATVLSSSSTDPGTQVRKSGTQARILDLQSDAFFREPRRLEEVLEELRIRGYHHNKSDVRMSLLRLARKKLLRRIALGEGRQRMYLYVSP